MGDSCEKNIYMGETEREREREMGGKGRRTKIDTEMARLCNQFTTKANRTATAGTRFMPDCGT